MLKSIAPKCCFSCRRDWSAGGKWYRDIGTNQRHERFSCHSCYMRDTRRRGLRGKRRIITARHAEADSLRDKLADMESAKRRRIEELADAQDVADVEGGADALLGGEEASAAAVAVAGSLGVPLKQDASIAASMTK